MKEFGDFTDKLHEREPKEYYELTVDEACKMCLDFYTRSMGAGTIAVNIWVEQWLKDNIKDEA